MKKSYLIHLKNELLIQGLFFSEIHDILADTGMYFDDTEKEESEQKAILEKLGTPKEFARTMQQTNTMQPANNIRLFRILLLLMVPLMFFTGIIILISEKQQIILHNRQIVASILTFASIILLWFMSGNACLLGIFPITKKQVVKWICFQVLLFISMVGLLYGMYIGVPAYVKIASSENILHTVAPVVQFVTILYVAINTIIVVYCLIAFVKAEWLMFGIFIQSIGLIFCAVFYEQYLGNLTVFDNIKYFPIPLLLSVLFSSIIYIMILEHKDGRQNGCAD